MTSKFQIDTRRHTQSLVYKIKHHHHPHEQIPYDRKHRARMMNLDVTDTNGNATREGETEQDNEEEEEEEDCYCFPSPLGNEVEEEQAALAGRMPRMPPLNSVGDDALDDSNSNDPDDDDDGRAALVLENLEEEEDDELILEEEDEDEMCTADYVLSDEDLDLSFLNMTDAPNDDDDDNDDDEMEDTTNFSQADFLLETVAAMHRSTNTALSSTDNSYDTTGTLIQTEAQRRSSRYRAMTQALAAELMQSSSNRNDNRNHKNNETNNNNNEDTTTSYHTDNGYADDESDQKNSIPVPSTAPTDAAAAAIPQAYSQPKQQQQRRRRQQRVPASLPSTTTRPHHQRENQRTSAAAGSAAAASSSLAATDLLQQQQEKHHPVQKSPALPSPSRLRLLTSLPSSSSSLTIASPSQNVNSNGSNIHTTPLSTPSAAVAAATVTSTNAHSAGGYNTVIPASASLFRYLRSWGRGPTEAEEPVLATGAAAADGESLWQTTTHNTTLSNNSYSNNATFAAGPSLEGVVGSGELTSDDEDDDLSMEDDIDDDELLSWVDDDNDNHDNASDSSVDDELNRRNWETPVDWSVLPMIPNRFCVSIPHELHEQLLETTTMTSRATTATEYIIKPLQNTEPIVNTLPTAAPLCYLDASLLHNSHMMSVAEANEFVWEHGTLLQALLQLLAERDQVGVEGSTDSTENIWKKGPLKKLSFAVGRRKHQRPEVAGAWKVKYIELRNGNLSYYEDSARTGRKTVHLRQTDAIVQESSYRGPGFVFELLVQGSPTRYWMASSEVERQAWIKAIQAAMIGNDAPRKELDLQPYDESLKVYTLLRDSLQQADSHEMYLAGIQATMKELASLQVPVQWVQERIENDLSPILLGTLKPPKFSRSPQKLLKSSISEFWRNMSRTTFSINGLTVPRNSQFASERVVGALARCILEFDKAFLSSDEKDDGVELSQISELQAVSYTRHILLTVLRSKERQDANFVVRYLLESPGVMVSEQCNAENPVNMEVSFAGEDLPDEFLHTVEIASWVWTRTRRKHQSAIAASVSTSMWKDRHTFAVLSGTVLSYYTAASPRPHGLRGQLVLSSTSSVREEGEEIVSDSGEGSNTAKSNGVRFVICISSERHQDRLLSFESQADAVSWKEAIQLAIDSAGSIEHLPRVVTTTTTMPLMAPVKMLKGAERAIKVAADGTIQGGIRVIKGAKDGGIRVIKGAKDGGIRVIKTATGSGFKVIRGAVSMLRQNSKNTDALHKVRRPSMQMLLNNTAVGHGKREPTVQCVFQTTQTYVIRDRSYTEHGSDQGTESGRSSSADDGWMSVQAKLYQAFLMSGGPSGRIARGDALVELVFVETKVENDDDGSC